MNPENFFSELKRRNVIRMAGLYMVGAWLLVQVAGTVLPMFGAPDWLPRSVVIIVAIGFLPALIFSWVFELTPEGLKRDEDVAPEQSITPRTSGSFAPWPNAIRLRPNEHSSRWATIHAGTNPRLFSAAALVKVCWRA